MRSSLFSALALASAAYAYPNLQHMRRFTNDTAPVPTEITTEFVYLCPTGLATEKTTVTTKLPAASSYDILPGWTTTVCKCNGCEDKETDYTLTLPPGVAPEVTGTAPETTGPTTVPASATADTTTADLKPTEITTEFVYLCPTGLATQETTVTTDLPAGTTVEGLIPGWTTTVTKCEVCDDKETEYTLTLPPGVAPVVSTGTAPETTGPTTVPASATADVTPTEITTEFVYLCPTGVATKETTVTTDLPSGPITGLIPGWTTTVTVCTACEDKTKEHTLTIPPGVAPVNPSGNEPLITETPSGTSEGASASATGETTPTKIVTNIEYICPTGIKTVETTISADVPVTTGSGEAPLPVGWTTTVTICTVCEDKTKSHTFTLPPGYAPTGDNSGPEVTGPTTVEVPSATGSGAPENSGVPVVDVPTPTGDEEVITTVIKTTYTAVCPTGLTKSVAEVTATIPATATGTDYTFSMTKTETICTACEAGSQTLTLEVPVSTPASGESGSATSDESSPATSAPVIVDIPTPTGDEEVITTVIKTTYTAVCPTGLTKSVAEVTATIPATATGTDYTFSMTKTETICTACEAGSQTLTLEVPVSTPASGESGSATSDESAPATSAPVIVDIPTPTGGEDVITTVIKTEYTAVCPTGLIKSTAEITATIPATATGTDYTFSMTKTETICTACQAGKQTLTLEVPVSTPVVSASETTSGESAPATSAPVVVDIPTPSGGEDVITTVIKTVYTAVCPTGLTKSTAEITKTIPATATESSYTFSMTKVETVCTACEAGSQTLTVEVPVSTPVKVSSPTSDESAPATGAPVVVDIPTPSAGEDVITTVIKTVYTAVCPTGLTKSTAEITKTIPATASASSYTFSMTKVETVCTACAEGSKTLTVEVPVSTPVKESSPTSDESAPATSVPVIDVPTATAGEDVITTVIKTVYTAVCPTGLTKSTALITATIPATATASSITISMTKVETVCTACEEGSKTQTLEVPVYTPAPSKETSSEAAPATTSVPVIDVPTATAGEDVITTVIKTVYTAVCPTGLTKSTALVTATIPATASASTYTFSMTKVETVCTACAEGSKTVTLDVPAYSAAPVAATSAPAIIVSVPSVALPTLTAGESGVETIISQTYEYIHSTGIATTVAQITATVPATYSAPITVSMTVVKTVCTACANGAGKTVAITVPAAFDTTTAPAPVYSTVVYSVTAPNGDVAAGTGVIEQPAGTTAPAVSAPGQVYETVVYNPSASAPAMSTVVTTAVYSTVGTSGLEAATSAITMAVPATASAPPQLQYDTTTTVCASCGANGGPQTFTITVPRATSTVTVIPTSLVTVPVYAVPVPTGTAAASASAGMPGAGNSTDGYYTPKLESFSPSATLALQGGDAGRVAVGSLSFVVAGVMAVVAMI